ncbi:hypothetical protein B0T17DRAFT_306001 [Bombardia bombarda]|uniref:Uncharacterized protein n=1 Tax=Bombardia bombarda TaxID=252184 RepID=A0AA39WV23_9PEZI|nr:hypothetical protein B0T17DRAFT_306001 [Bombardia bombarda]
MSLQSTDNITPIFCHEPKMRRIEFIPGFFSPICILVHYPFVSSWLACDSVVCAGTGTTVWMHYFIDLGTKIGSRPTGGIVHTIAAASALFLVATSQNFSSVIKRTSINRTYSSPGVLTCSHLPPSAMIANKYHQKSRC